MRVSDFRCIKEVELALGSLTLLLGANNSGKTSFLDALSLAVGAGRSTISREDIHLAPGEADTPGDRCALVDVLIYPTDVSGQRSDGFEAGGFWTNLWGEGICQDDEGRDYVALRACLSFSMTHGEYRVERRFLKEWLVQGDWRKVELKGRVSAAQVEPLAMHYIDAQRDLSEDLRHRGSFWNRLTDELGLTAAEVSEFEAVLSEVNRSISAKSAVLNHVGTTLAGIGVVLAADATLVSISPVASRLRDVSRSLNVSVSSGGTQAFPLGRQGMGTRSMASLLVFKAFAEWKRKTAETENDAVHTFLALEEPEAHLHPQAQRSLFRQIRNLPGQRVVSTHSPYIAGQASLEELRLFRRQGGQTRCVALDTSKLKDEDRRKLEQVVIATRGDILFARAIVLFEGETEGQALPIFAQARWNATIHELGFSFVGVGGNRNYYPFIWLAENFGIPWFILSDGEAQTVSIVEGQLSRADCGNIASTDCVILLPDGLDFESYLLAEGYLPQVEKAISAWSNKPNFLSDYMARMHGMNGPKKTVRDYAGPDGREQAILHVMKENKTSLAVYIASVIVVELNDIVLFPPKLLALFEAMDGRLGTHQPLTSGE